MGVYHPLRTFWRMVRNAQEVRTWKRRGCPVPPPHLIKQQVLCNYAKEYETNVFVETGTFYGDMVEGMRHVVKTIHSVELSRDLYERAVYRFRNDPHIHLVHGDSGEVLDRIVRELHESALFWLDGHYSGGITARGQSNTPVVQELESVLRFPEYRHVVVIDDVHCFGTEDGYPTMTELRHIVHQRNPVLRMIVANNMIAILPAPSKAQV